LHTSLRALEALTRFFAGSIGHAHLFEVSDRVFGVVLGFVGSAAVEVGGYRFPMERSERP
jgi:hypothetical protein